jgi:biopolymer transport protein ExbD
MNFKSRSRDEPEINLIPFIDVLLVVLIFLMLSTTYSKYTELQIRLPQAESQPLSEYPKEVILAINSDGAFKIKGTSINPGDVVALRTAIANAAEKQKNTVLVIHADASAKHQSVVSAINAARLAGVAQITFAAQGSGAPQR